MTLPKELIDKFVAISTPPKEENPETTMYGTLTKQGENYFVTLDGAYDGMLTPVSVTVDAVSGERVVVLMKNHQALVIGNTSSPSATEGTVVTKVNEVRAEYIAADEILANDISAANADITELNSKTATIETLVAGKVSASELEATEARLESIIADKIDAEDVEATYATITSLNATNANVSSLTTRTAAVETLAAGKVSAEQVAAEYAKIDFANIGTAAVEKLFSESGMIADLVMEDGHVTGELNAVRVNGDLITAGTIAADRIIVRGEDGLYYELHKATLSEAEIESETEDDKTIYQNGLDGRSLVASSVTADKIFVSDLSAFGATIGGFNLDTESISSIGKDNPESAAPGVYMDANGQFSVGNGDAYLRFVKLPNSGDDDDEKYELKVAASAIVFTVSSPETGDISEETLDKRLEDVNQSVQDVAASVSDYDELKNRVNSVAIDTENVAQSVKDISDNVSSLSNTLETTFAFDPATGLIIGQRRADSNMVLSSGAVNINVGNTTVANLSGDGLRVPNGAVICKTFTIGDYTFSASDDGHLTIM